MERPDNFSLMSDAETGKRPASASSFTQLPTWSSRAVYLVGALMTVTGFILGCVATGISAANSNAIRKLQRSSVCAHGDVLFGEPLLKGGNDNYYQIIGTHGAQLTWMEAYDDARSRCFQGHQGYIAAITSEDENKFILNAFRNTLSFQDGDHLWLGGGDTGTEGVFAWIGPNKLAEGVVFFQQGVPVNGAYTNWLYGEPNEGAGTKSEDCMFMAGGGQWVDKNCYETLPFFVVEFGDPAKLVTMWDAEHDDKINDDYLATKAKN